MNGGAGSEIGSKAYLEVRLANTVRLYLHRPELWDARSHRHMKHRYARLINQYATTKGTTEDTVILTWLLHHGSDSILFSPPEG